MRIPISWLKDYVDAGETAAALAERLTLAGLEVEAVHPSAGGASGEVLEIALTPDLARCMSVVGVAREVAALTGAALRLPAARDAAASPAGAPETTETGGARGRGEGGRPPPRPPLPGAGVARGPHGAPPRGGAVA